MRKLLDDMIDKGRLIPKISMSQYFNTSLKWFGTDETLIKQLLPEEGLINIKKKENNYV